MDEFFSDRFQGILKKRAASENNNAYTLNDYLAALYAYKKLFFEELNIKGNIVISSGSAKSCDSFKKDMYQNILAEKLDWISNCFDEIISILTDFNKSQLELKNRLKEYLDSRCTGWSVAGAMELSKPMFRARKTGKYKRHIHELYHVPFTKKNILSDERFSSTKKPMLYLSETIEGTLHEIHLKFDEANYAMFVPKYSNFYKQSAYDINNSIQSSLYAVHFMDLEGGRIEYANTQFTFSKRTINQYLAEFILYQILLFSVCDACRGNTSKYPQYILPQTIMEIVTEKNVPLIMYHSASEIRCRDYDQFYDQHDKNLCINIPEAEEYNDQYLKNFFTAMWFQGDKMRTIEEVIKLRKECGEIIQSHSHTFNMNDYSLYLINIDSHMENMNKAVKNYEKSLEGQVEVTLFYDFLQQIMPIIKEPEKHGIVKRKEV